MSDVEIQISKDNTFESTIPVAFSHISGMLLKSDSKLTIQFSTGRVEIIWLKNPKKIELPD